MNRIKGLVLLAGAALGVGAGSALAQQQVSTDEVRAVVAEMLSDAETRSSLLAGGDAGHDGKFFIAGDGFRLNIGGMLQFRYNLNFRNSDSTVADDDFNSGFQATRTKLIADGRINKDWDFRIMGDFIGYTGGSGGTFTLEDAYARYNFANGWKLQWGQFKLPLLREELVSDAYQLAAERSITNYAYSQQWSQGVQLEYDTETWRLMIAASNGLFSQNTDFGPTAAVRENTAAFVVAGVAEWAVTGRFEYLFSGNWKQFQDFTSPKGSDFGAMVGIAGHYQQSKNTGSAADVDRDTLEYTGDVSFKGDSWNLYGAFIGRYTKFHSFAGGTPDFNDFGAVVQGGWRFAENTELFARWDAIFLDSDRGTNEDTYHFGTVGLNHYFAGHAAKFTVDAIYAFQDTSSLITGGLLPSTNTGIFGESDKGEVAVQVQFQLLF